jgi:hypothetical protein
MAGALFLAQVALFTTPARADADGGAEGAPPSPDAEPRPTTDGGTGTTVEAASEPDLAHLAAETAALKKELEQQKKELEEQKKALSESVKTTEDVSAKVDSAATASDNDWTNKFKIYGFTDVGLNRVWVDERSPTSNFINSANATSFVIGNLNLYFDAQPIKGWRSLVEIRFTNAPHGEITSVGGLGGTFNRTTTGLIDPHANSVAGYMWGGYTVIERAHIDWTDLQFLKLRVGSFFTPFGIWNVDHGTPTLIAVQLPMTIQFRQMPLRQTGLQVYGSTFKGDWELGYMATVTNGRQELSNFAFDDNRGFGGRLYANNERGDITAKFGASFYTGRVRDEQVNLTNLNPITLEQKSNFSYREVVGGLDASLDIGRTRLRAEATMNSIQYDDGKHEASVPLIAGTNAYKPNSLSTTGYFLAAHQLPWIPVEPFATVDVVHTPLGFANLVMLPSLGFNVRLTKAVTVKTQFSKSFLTDTDRELTEVDKRNEASFLFSRLVMVF